MANFPIIKHDVFSHITPIFNRLQCYRLYDALAADEQRRVVQLSFTGCMNFSDVSGCVRHKCWHTARWMDETAREWLEWRWVNLTWRKSAKMICRTHAFRVFDMVQKTTTLHFKYLQIIEQTSCVKPFIEGDSHLDVSEISKKIGSS